MEAVLRWFEQEGSTRPAGLLRAGFAAVLWVRYGDEMGLHLAGGWNAAALSAAFFLGTGLLFVGLATRFAAVLTALVLGFLYFGAGWGGGAIGWTHHHVYLTVAVAALLALSPCGRSFSIDRLRELAAAARAGRPPAPERAPLVAMRLIALQIAAVYLWGAVDKMTPGWITGARLEQVFWWHYEGRALFDVLAAPPVPMVLANLVLALEVFIAPGILFRRTQPWAVPAAFVLHAAFYLLVPVKTFSATMMLCYLAVIDADATDRLIGRFAGRAP